MYSIRTTAFSLLLLWIAPLISRGQATGPGCNGPYPFFFCEPDGTVCAACSNHPNSEALPPMRRTAIPGCWKPYDQSVDPTAWWPLENDFMYYNQDPNANQVTIYTPASLTDDLNEAMSEWNSICPPSGNPNSDCCVYIHFIDDINDLLTIFPGTTLDTWNHISSSGPVSIPAATQPGFSDLTATKLNSSCTLGCPDKKVTGIFIQDDQEYAWPYGPNDDYTSPRRGYYTGHQAPNVGNNHILTSFLEIVEHEMGHWFGLAHADLEVPGCSHGDCMIMSHTIKAYGNQTPPAARVLTCDDFCEFKMLYCPNSTGSCPANFNNTPCPVLAGATGSTSDCPQISIVANYSESAKLFDLGDAHPDPSTGEFFIPYSLKTYSTVSITIYDILGKVMERTTDGSKGPGNYSIGVDASSWPIGKYYYEIQVNGASKTKSLIHN
jgi:hypothetical protein